MRASGQIVFAFVLAVGCSSATVGEAPEGDVEELVGAVVLTSTAVSTTTVGLSWSTSRIRPARFEIKRGSSGSSLITVAMLASTETKFTDAAVSAGTTYSYRVVATATNGKRYGSNVVAVPIPSVSVCGDGVCDDPETCTGCAADCGSCGPALVGQWSFDEASGQVLVDSAGTNNGVLGLMTDVESSDATRVAGRSGNALSFDGAAKQAMLPAPRALSAFSYVAWIYPTGWGANGFGRILSKESIAGFDDVWFNVSASIYGASGTLAAAINDDSDTVATSANSLQLNTWQQVAVTYDDATDRTLRLYVNGKEVGYVAQLPSKSALSLTGNPLIVGNRPGHDRGFQGVIDDVRVYDGALGAAEIAALYDPAIVSCSFMISPSSASLAAQASSGSVTVTAGAGCAWSSSSNVAWITTSSSGVGNGIVNYSVSANSANSARSGTLTIAGQTFTVTQAAASSSSSGNTYYVDVTTGSDSNPGTSQAAPWAHLPGSIGPTGPTGPADSVKLRAGDVVYVKGGSVNKVQVVIDSNHYVGDGNYDSIRLVSGHLASPPWGSDRAVFDEEGLSTSGRTFGIAFTGTYYNGPVQGVTLDGFEIREIKSGASGPGYDDSDGSSCVLVGGAYPANWIKLRRLWLHNAYRKDLSGNDHNDRGHGVETSRGHDLIVENNLIGPMIGTKGVEPYKTNNGIIRNNYITNTGDHGIALTGDRWDVYNNIVNMSPPLAHDPVYAMKVAGGQTNDIWNNLFFTANPTLPSPLEDRPQGLGIFDTPNNRAYHNTIYNFANTANGGQYGTCISIGSENNAAASNNEVQNNLTYNCRNIGNIQFWMYGGTSGNHIAFNNFFYQSASDEVVQVGPSFYTAGNFNGASLPGASTASDNVQFLPNFQGGTLPNGLNGNFQPNSDYFKLTSNTAAAIRQTARPLRGDDSHGYSPDPNKFATDILGKARSGWSMGAYEY